MMPPDPDLAIGTSYADPLPGYSRQGGKSSLYRRSLKRVLDIFLVLLSLPFVVPLVAVLALLVRCDGGPAFYRQTRVGRGGQGYTMWKLRTMVTDAEARFKRLLATDVAARDEWNATQKLKHDPRITRIGRWLRRSSLDELPQLWNVLNGSMSLVGPRPMMPCQKPLYQGRAYYRLLPGITGPWQVSARNDSRFDDRVAFDDGYERDLSMRTDVGLILRTVRVVLHATGH